MAWTCDFSRDNMFTYFHVMPCKPRVEHHVIHVFFLMRFIYQNHVKNYKVKHIWTTTIKTTEIYLLKAMRVCVKFNNEMQNIEVRKSRFYVKFLTCDFARENSVGFFSVKEKPKGRCIIKLGLETVLGSIANGHLNQTKWKRLLVFPCSWRAKSPSWAPRWTP